MKSESWITGILKWFMFIIPFYFFLLLFSGLVFGSVGPILVMYGISVFFGFKVIGFHYEKKSSTLGSSVGISRWGSLVISHSHHFLGKGDHNHEIKIRNKSFCARCYGLLVGIGFSLVVATNYLVNYNDYRMFSVLLPSLPLLGILLGLYFLTKRRYKAAARFSSGFILPILAWNILITFDCLYHSGIINCIILFLVFSVTTLTGFYRLRQKSIRHKTRYYFF